MSKRKSKTPSASQRILWVLSLIIVGSMVISLIIVALPSGTDQTPTPLPTLTPAPTHTSLPSPTPEPTHTQAPIPTVEATAPPVGPVLPSATP